MTITTIYSSNQIPIPLGSSTSLSVGNGTGGPFTVGMTQGLAALLNQMATKVQILAQVGGGGSGVINGLELSAGTGLQLQISVGTAYASDIISTSSSVTVVLPDASPMIFVWLTGSGTIAWNQDHTTPPSGGLVFLGTVATATGVIVSIDNSGRVAIYDGQRWRSTNDLIAPVDAPPASIRIFTQTQFGVFFWNGAFHVPMMDLSHQRLDSTRSLSLQADLTLVLNDANGQWLIANGGARNVILPPIANLNPGHWFEIVNAGNKTNGSQNYNLTLKDSLGNVISTIAPGESASAKPIPGSNGVGSVWPATITPATPS